MKKMSWQPSGARSGEREKRKFISAQKLCHPIIEPIGWKLTYREVSAVTTSKNPAGSV